MAAHVYGLEIDNDNTASIELRDLPADMFADPDTGAINSSASPQVRITTSADVDVPGPAWPISMTYDGTEQQYNGVLPYTAVLTHGTAYKVVITAGSTFRKEFPAIAEDPRGGGFTQAERLKIAREAGIA